MARYRESLPQLSGRFFLTDAGLETDIIFNKGVQIPEFAAHTLLPQASGRQVLKDYFRGFLSLASEMNAGFQLDSQTWKAHMHWADNLKATEGELDTPVYSRGCETIAVPSKSELLELPPKAFLACLRTLVDYHLCEQVPDLKTVATICELAPRTLQRRLADQGLTFASLLDSTRQRRSKHLLVDTDMSLADIAHVQGYSDYQKFSRAFKRWTGETPRRYRQRSRQPLENPAGTS